MTNSYSWPYGPLGRHLYEYNSKSTTFDNSVRYTLYGKKHGLKRWHDNTGYN